MFAAATDTTAATLEWAMAELIRNPHTMARAKLEVRERLGEGRSTVTSEDLSDLRYLRMVVKETLRLHPAAPLILRASQQDCQVMGYDIPKGTHVTTNAFAVGRDPAHWGKDAEEFRPERFQESGADSVEYKHGMQMEFIPFGAGRRQCPGTLFATTTIELVLANLLYQNAQILRTLWRPDSISNRCMQPVHQDWCLFFCKNDPELFKIFIRWSFNVWRHRCYIIKFCTISSLYPPLQ
jgi:cytochrome P450